MTKIINTLLIDDHPFIIDAYKNYLEQYEVFNPNVKFTITSATDSDMAIESLKRTKELFELAFLDIRIPESKDGKFKSGEDIGIYIRNNSPKTKIVVITGHFDALLLSGILQNINPDGLLYKSDVVGDTISETLKSIFENVPYYSSRILVLLRKKIASKIILDRIDKLLLYELSKGTKTKDLIKTLPLSIGGIEKRKRNLKELFGVTSKDDDALINSVIKKGFL
jgi:DNA-binding NarL/FixJ family response regulator